MQVETFGQHIRQIRTAKKLLLREVAASLEIDPSLLSRIDTGEKRATREQVIRLAIILGASEDDLLIHFLSDRVVYELQDERLAMKAIVAAERKITSLRKRKARS